MAWARSTDALLIGHELVTFDGGLRVVSAGMGAQFLGEYGGAWMR